jgi:hypothetical protein
LVAIKGSQEPLRGWPPPVKASGEPFFGTLLP